ncbi:MAG: DNA phosphorothioation system sulfurtransferase DndC, partial [Chloroflexi bacterium]|nr:DNA phosphorothioation system sulfurtransferase DndC [Chloroflexota bacterium]
MITSKQPGISVELSFFSENSIGQLYQQIQEVYRQNSSPWVIGYSGGKDSTAVLQAVWYALADLPVEKRTKRVYVLASDTLVETPVIVDQIDQTLGRINAAASTAGMPFEAH